MWLVASNFSAVLLGLGLAIAAIILLRRIWRYQSSQKKTKKKKPVSAKQDITVPRSTPLIDAPVEAVRWSVEMHEIARELKADLDTRIAIATALNRQAKEQTRKLEEAIRHAQQLGARVEPDTLELMESLDHLSPEEASQTVARLGASEPTGNAVDDPLRGKIMQMAGEGRNANVISEKLGIPLGDVELTLAMFQAHINIQKYDMP